MNRPDPLALRCAGEQLLAALQAKSDPCYRLAVLKRLARRLGDTDYPLLLRLMLLIGEQGDALACTLLAETIATGLERADLPSGQLTSWGGSSRSSPLDASFSLDAALLSRNFFANRPDRRLGPIEYLAVWHGQRTQRGCLSHAAYIHGIARLIALFNHSARARTLYPRQLEADSQSNLEGAYTRSTRERLAAIARLWRDGAAPETIAAATAQPNDAAHSAGLDWIRRDL